MLCSLKGDGALALYRAKTSWAQELLLGCLWAATIAALFKGLSFEASSKSADAHPTVFNPDASTMRLTTEAHGSLFVADKALV